MNKPISRIASCVCLASMTSLLIACSTPPRPVEELTRARTMIEQAEQAGAQEFAGAELERAREQLRQANAAAEKKNEKDMDTARRMALQAASDAQLAAAKTRQAKAERAAQEVATGTQTLQQETDRAADQKEQQLQTPAQ